MARKRDSISIVFEIVNELLQEIGTRRIGGYPKEERAQVLLLDCIINA